METSASGHRGAAHEAQHPTRRTLLGSLAAFGALGTAGSLPAFAQQDYPTRPVRLIVPYEAGTLTDQVGRAVGQALAARLKQTLVIDNRPGAGGLIGTSAAAKAAPDGYTLLWGSNGTHAINPALHAKLPYDAIQSFSPISLIGSGYSLLVVHPSVEARNVTELIALAKAKPGELRFGSGGIGTTPHLAGELFKLMSGAQIEHVAYKGSTHSALDLLEGRIQMIFANVASVLPHVKAGKLRVLGVTSQQRVADFPDVPTIGESGLPGFSAELWIGLFAPAGVSPQIVDLLNQSLRSELANEELARNFARQGFIFKTSTPQAFGTYVREEMVKWGAVVKASGAKPE